MGVIEYVILIGFSIWGLVFALSHHHGSFPITSDWFNLSGIGGQGSLASGLLIAVFMLAGWDATVYVNEEVKHRRHNPGKAAVIAVALLIAIYTFSQVGLQGWSRRPSCRPTRPRCLSTSPRRSAAARPRR